MGTAGTPEHIFSVLNSLLFSISLNTLKQSRIVLSLKIFEIEKEKEKVRPNSGFHSFLNSPCKFEK